MTIPICKPHLPEAAQYAEDLAEIFASGQLTNGRLVRTLEERVAARLGVDSVVAFSSATTGLMLAMKTLGEPGDEVLLPSFTFPATIQAVVWAGLKPRLVDCDPETFNVTAETVARALTPRSRFLIPVYVFGAPPRWDLLGPLAEREGLTVVSDAAHALGSTWEGRPVGGMAAAEIFSLAPTKLLVAAEGGLAATNDRALSDRLRLARNHGNSGDYVCNPGGLNGRMSELHALLALKGLPGLDGQIRRRQELWGFYRRNLNGVPGISFQKLPWQATSTWNYIGLRFDPEAFGATAAGLQQRLAERGIESRRYFHPPLHVQESFQPVLDREDRTFPGTDRLVSEILCLPIWSDLGEGGVGRVTDEVRSFHASARRLAGPSGDRP